MRPLRFAIALVSAALAAQSPKYGVGRTPTAEEMRAMDLSILPDGTGLPEGRGTVADGRDIYAVRCARCHGAKGEGGDEPKQSPLVGGQGTLKTPKPLKTIGSYWPYAPTIWDYVNRAMPLDRPGTLTHDQVYSLVAFLLRMNGVIGENDVLDAKTLPKIRMPNRDGFVPDARPDVEKPAKKTVAKTSGS